MAEAELDDIQGEEGTDGSSGVAGRLLTLTEVSRLSGISMPTLQRYKKMYQDRIPSEGRGRTQRYYPESIAIFRELKKENIGRRGRPRKKQVDELPPAVAAPPKRRGRSKENRAGMLTLTEISKRTGISYPTLLRYVRRHLDEIPHMGEGRARRYPDEAVEVFNRLRSESGRGRRRRTPVEGGGAVGLDAAATERIRNLERQLRELERHIKRLEKEMYKPFKVTLQR
ncbi:MAG: helix-turn-helix domain-containing protein [Acidobacteriota bacterium]